MIKKMLIPVFAFSALCFASCNNTSNTETHADSTVSEMPKQDLAAVKAEIAAVETAWADALNKKDINALMALYADDAVTMPDGEPMISGKAEIQKKEQKDFMDSANYSSIAFETLDVFGQGDVVTEVGKTMFKDAAGKTIGTAKYMAVFEKRDGKWLCIREIYNGDSK